MPNPLTAGGDVKTPVGDAPLIPLFLVFAGGYFLWFGIHYWRDQTTRWPSDPVKDVLQGKGIPKPNPEKAVAEDIAGATSIASSGSAPGSDASGDSLAADMQGYVGKVPYVWGGANPATGWDCSGAVNYCANHDCRLDIPDGIKGGTFTGKTHGPTTVDWIGWTGCKTIPRAQIQAGDLCVWQTHMGVAISNTEYVSAVDPKQGTAVGPIDGGGPTGEVLVPRRIIQTITAPTGDSTGSVNVQQNQNTAALLATPLGWGPSSPDAQTGNQEWNDLVSLWEKESSWSQYATNPSSGAYGIPQALPPTKMPKSAQKSGGSDVTAQITWGLSYIATRWGSPSKAWANEQSAGWY